MASRTRTRAGNRRPSKSSSSLGPILAGVGACVAVVVLIAFAAGGGSEPAAAQSQPEQRDPAPAPAAARSAPLPAASDRGGSAPDRPAPPIRDEDLATADRHFEAAKALWNEGHRLHETDAGAYAKKVQEAFDEMEKLRETLRPYTDWFEEADLSGWAMPGSYVALQKRLGAYDRHYQKIKKVKQLER